MNMEWSLDELYTSFDSEEYNSDLLKFNDKIEDLIKWADSNLINFENSKAKIEDYLEKTIELSSLASKLMGFSNLKLSTEAKNELALQNMDKLQVKSSDMTKPSVQFENFIGELENLEDIIASSEFLQEHAFYLGQIKKNTEYLLSEKEEVLISKMSNTGANAWSNLQDILLSTLLVDIVIDGEEKQLPLPIVRNLAHDKDSEVRKTAYEAELKSYKKVEESSAASLNGIKGQVITTADIRGYDSPLDETLIKSRMDKETLDAMLTAMEESLPMFHKYFRKKAELLGHEGGLPFYDMFAPVGEMDKVYSYKDARDYIVKNFKTFSSKLADFADNAFEKRWIDAEPKEGKRGGAFCSTIHPIKESRILTNFNGSFSNVITLSHELGHGYHGLCLRDETILNSRYPMPLAETASIFSETIVMNAALEEATEVERLSILESYISDAAQVIVDIYSRFLFEKELFETRKDHTLSVNEFKDAMIRAQKNAYGNGLDHELLHPYMWINKTHYYSAGRNYYNFPYAFGLLFSKGLYVQYLEDKDEFIGNYDDFLRATGKNNIVDTAKIMDIDVHSVDFFKSSLDSIKQDIETFIQLADNI